MGDENRKRYVSIKEAASLLGVSSQTLRNWEKRGELVPYRNPINKYRMYDVSELEGFLQSMRSERFKKGKFKLKIVSITD